jgi:hypothetical protein
VVDEAVAHAGGGAPGNIGQGGATGDADALGGFTDDLDQLGQGESEQLIVVEVDALLAFAVADGFGGRLAQVAVDGFGLQAA